jgi:hypothetical protein
VSAPASDAAAYVAGGVRLGYEHEIVAPFSVRAHVDALATLTLHRVDVGGQTVTSLRVLSGAAGAELVVRFR